MGGTRASWTALGLAAAVLALPPAAPAGTLRIKAKLPKAGGLALTQVQVKYKKKPRRAPRLVLVSRRGIPSTVAAVGALRRARGSKRVYVARLVLLRRPSARALAAQDLGFATFGVRAPGISNRGVTGSAAFNALITPGGPTPANAGAFCAQDINVQRQVLGFEKTFLDGGMVYLPNFAPALLPLAGEAVCKPEDAFGDLTLVFKYAFEDSGPQTPLSSGLHVQVPLSPTDVAAGDVNGDGRADLLLTGLGPGSAPRLTILPGLGEGTFGLPLNLPLGATPQALGVGDLDLDGRDDVIVAEGQAVQVFDPITGLPVNVSAPRPVDGLAVGDFDADGDVDFFGGGAGGLVPFVNTGGTFTPGPPITDRPIDSVLFGRFDNDPIGDVLFASPDPARPGDTDVMGWSQTHPSVGLFGSAPGANGLLAPVAPGLVGMATDEAIVDLTDRTFLELGTPPPGPSDFGAADLNSDGIPELLILDGASGALYPFFFSGTTVTPVAPLLPGIEPTGFVPFSVAPGQPGKIAVADKTGRSVLFADFSGLVAPSEEFVGRVPTALPPRVPVGSTLTNPANVTQKPTKDTNHWPKNARVVRQAGGRRVSVTQAGRITEFALRGYGASPSGTPVRFRVLRPQADGTWVPVLTSKFVTLPPDDGVHRYPTSDLDPNGANAFPVQPGDEVGVFQNADAPGLNPGDPTPWTIFSSDPGSSMYEVAIHDGFNNGSAETPTTVDGLELLLQATVEPIACPGSATPYEPCAADIVGSVGPTGGAKVGQAATFADKVRNIGPAPAHAVTLTHGFPRGARLGPLPAGCTRTVKAPPVVRCDVGDLAPGAPSRELRFTMTPTRKGKQVNSARAASPTYDPNLDNDATASVQTVH
jgi:hypothetical protein